MIEAVRNAILANSQAKTKLHELQEQDSPEADALATAKSEYRESEAALRSAVVSDEEKADEPVTVDSEYREKMAIRERANLGVYVSNGVENTIPDGAEAEFSAAFGLKPGYAPLAILEPSQTELREKHAQTEYRAVTDVPSTDAQGSRAAYLPAVFERSSLAALGMTFPSVAQGIPVYPALTTAPPAAVKAKGGTVPSTAAVFDIVTRKPRRIGGRFTVPAENLAVLPGMEQELRAGLADAASDAVDSEGFSGGSDGDGAIGGLIGVSTDATADTAVATFVTFVSKIAALVGTKHAYSWSDIRMAVGSATFAHLAGLFQSNGDSSAWDYMAARLGAVRVSDRLPDKASNAQVGLVTLNAMRQQMKMPVWDGIRFVRDEISNAAEGQTHVTAYLLIGSPVVPYTTAMIKQIHPKLS